jgi:hypothetical protein
MARRYSTARAFYSITMLCLGALYSAHSFAQIAASPDLLEVRARLQEAEARQAIAEAERAELLARLPPAQTKALGGSVDTRGFGAAGLARAFDLTLELAAEVCHILPPDRIVILFDPLVSQGIVVARTVDAALVRQTQELAVRNAALQRYIEGSTPAAARRRSAPLLAWLTAPTMVLRAGADLASLFKSDTTLAGAAYGDGARDLFASAMARSCPARLAGLSGGYMGELDVTRHAALLERVRLVGLERAALAQHIDALDVLAAGAKGERKQELAAIAAAATVQLKAVDSFIDSLRAGEASDKSPLFTTARYLGQAGRSAGALILDIDLRLEGLAVQRDHVFTGERLALSGVAFLWYRLHEPDGRLVRADALRRISRPVQVDLRGAPGSDGFWDASGLKPPRP